MKIRMKNLMVLMTAGLIMGVALNAGALTLSNLSITDTDTGTVTVSVDVSDTSMMSPSMCFMEAELTNGLSKCYAEPENVVIVTDQTWTSTNWSPYFRGVYTITVNGMSFSQDSYPTITQISTDHTITTNRQVSGTINSIKYQDAQTNWSDINLSNVKLHCTGMMTDLFNAQVMGCNLLNNTVDIFSGEEQAEDECPFDDIAEHYPAGTVFRFSLDLHARSTTFMAMGHLQRYVWTPDDTNSPSGSGTLEMDIMSCSPWRSSASNAIGAHVGFSPVYLPEGQMEAESVNGSVMCTTAHYMDVYPTNTNERIGIIVNGHPGTTNYLQIFMPDHLIEEWGVTNVETEIGGFVNGELVDSSLLDITQIESVTNNIVYDSDGDGVGDSGYLFQFTFEYSAQTITKASTDSVIAQVGLTSSVSLTATSALVGDYDGDGTSDLAIFDSNTGYWYIYSLSGSVIAWAVEWGWPGAKSVPGDFDGDEVSDIAVFDDNTGNWYIRTVSDDVLAWGISWGWPGAIPVWGDYDGGGASDLAVFDSNTGYWYVYSLSGSVIAWAVGWGWPGAVPVAGDYDGDGASDLAVFDSNTGYWYIRTVSGSVISWAVEWGWQGAVPVPGDYDGDGISDLAVFDSNTGYWYIRTVSGSVIAWAVEWGWPGAVPVPGDYDNDGISDLAVFDSNTGYWYILAVDGSVITWAKAWGWSGAIPVGSLQ